MSLYVPSSFEPGDRAAAARLVHDHPFATLVTPADPEPLISHVPLLLQPTSEPHGTLVGHVARANPHWRAAPGVESIAVFHGPHAYVSPSWYADPAAMVPTWNYATVHAHGPLEIVDDAAEARGVLEALVHRFESDRESPWSLAMPEAKLASLVGAIVAFRIRIRRLDVKFKLSQNRTRDDRSRVIRALDASGDADALATARWMRAYADPERT
ncbi:MAG: FMN-binding negative transcriptional regulator [Burkholderiales bacterium]|nr:FMN-binding negative transcriptional regulator [Burkholderiales bacterium]